ncbi:MAG: Stealth CR1 domain-containing protein [Clostridia bacterium]|nr:Stealth CR1 domain-containing protein [Clostridia bacterium]
MEEKIDFVIIWVDGGDKEWQQERNKYAGKDPEDIAEYRFRDWDNLKYWFRAVEKYAPWVNNVFFVTNGQKPEWLNINCTRLKWIKHEDYIPKKWLPTFSSHPIELNLHRIEELSNKFVYFNDDMFLTDYVTESDFFDKGLPKYYAQLDINLNVDELFGHIILNDAQFINQNIELKEYFKSNKKKWFDNTHSFKNKFKNYFLSRYGLISSIKNLHLPSPILKSTIDELWNSNPETFEMTCNNKFRSITDINQYVFSWYDIVRGNFSSVRPNIGNYYIAGPHDKLIADSIKNRKYKLLCINDTNETVDFEKSKKIINDAFESVLHEKSEFEI